MKRCKKSSKDKTNGDASTSMTSMRSAYGNGNASQRSDGDNSMRMPESSRFSARTVLDYLSFRTARSEEDSPSDSQSFSTPVSEPSLRLNPAYVKKLKLLPDSSASEKNSSSVVTFTGKGISRPASASGRDTLKIGEAKESDRGVFGGMFESKIGCFPMLAKYPTLFKEKEDPQSIELQPFDRRTPSMEKREKNKMPPKRTQWWQVTLYIINDAVGAWLILYSSIILGMYGWILGMCILIFLWPLNLYTAHLLWRCRNVFPGAISIGDLVYYLTRSPVAMYVTVFFVNVTILLTLASQIETSSANIYWFFSDNPMLDGECYVIFLVGVCAVLFPLTQLRYLHSLTGMNIVNIICMLIFVCISVYYLVMTGRDPGAVTRPEPNSKAIKDSIELDGFDGEGPPILGIDIIITAYYYQLIILEIIAEMEDPAEFPKANYWSTPIVLFVALASAATQYYYQGEEEELKDSTVQQVLTSIFDYDTDGRSVAAHVAVICFSVHMIGCCVLRSVILTRSFHLLINPVVANKNNWRARLEWAGISFVVILVAFVLTIFIRYLGLMALLNGFLALLTSIILPIVCYLICCGKRKIFKKMPKQEWPIIGLILGLAAVTVIVYILKLVERVNKSDVADNFTNSTLSQVETIMDCSNFIY